MGSFLRSVLKDNVFSVRMELYFEQPNCTNTLDRIEIQAKIDTGCYDSFISYDSMFIVLSDKELLKEKAKWLKCRKFGIGYGVETKSGTISYPKTLNDALNNKHIYTVNNYYDVDIGGVNVGNIKMNTSFDRNEKVLLGMGIFKDWDFHVGKNNIGETVFIGCPNDSLNQEYYRALENEFGITPKLNAAIVYEQIN